MCIDSASNFGVGVGDGGFCLLLRFSFVEISMMTAALKRFPEWGGNFGQKCSPFAAN